LSPDEQRQNVSQLQQKLLSDPQIMEDIKSLVQDPELMQLLSDPELIRAAVNNDVEQIKNNRKEQDLLAEPTP